MRGQVGDINLASMNGQEMERKRRLLLTEYEMVLREYLQLKEQSDSSQSSQIAELEKSMQWKGAMIDALQKEREDDIDNQIEWWEVTKKDVVAMLQTELHTYRQDFAAIPSDLNVPRWDMPFREERRYYDRSIVRLEAELRGRGVKLDTPKFDDPALRIAAQVQNKLNAITALERQRDEDLKNAPSEHHEFIKRAYGKALDAMKKEL
jgi:hypothetical protein